MIQNLATQKMLEELKNQIFDEEHPVGSHEPQFAGEQEPAARKGWRGTWTIDTDYTGRVIVGSGTGFTLGATGGSDNHYHEAGPLVAQLDISSVGQIYLNSIGDAEPWNCNYITSQFGTSSPGTTNPISYAVKVGGRSAQASNMQPYKVVAIWKRIA